MNDFVVTLTEKAANMILDTIEAQEVPDAYLSFYVSGGGCSGLQYGLALLEGEPEIDDVITYSNGVKIAVEFKSAKYISGSIIDYIDNEMGGGFKIDNPKATKSCGCSGSFAVDDMNEIDALNQGSGCKACKS